MAVSTDELLRKAAGATIKTETRGRPPAEETVSQGPISKRVVKVIGDITEAKMYANAFPGIPPEQLVGKTIELSQPVSKNLTADLYDVIEFQKAVYMLKMLQQGMTGGNEGAGKSSSLTIEDVRKVLDDSKKEDLLKTIIDRLDRMERGDGIGARKGATPEDVEKLVNERLRDEQIKRLEDDKRELQTQMTSTPKESPEMKFLQVQLDKTLQKLDSLSQDKFVRDVADTMSGRFAPLESKLKDLDDRLKTIPTEEHKGILEQSLGSVEKELADDIGKAILTRFRGGESDLITKDKEGKFTLDINAAVNKFLGIVETAIEKLPATGQQAPLYRPAQLPTSEQSSPPSTPSTPPPTSTPSAPPPEQSEHPTEPILSETPVFMSGKTEPIRTENAVSSAEAGQSDTGTPIKPESSPDKLETNLGRPKKGVGRR